MRFDYHQCTTNSIVSRKIENMTHNAVCVDSVRHNFSRSKTDDYSN